MVSSWATLKTGTNTSAFRLQQPDHSYIRFYAEFGERIDHQRFSFRSLTDLVRAIPSLVVFYDTGARARLSAFSLISEVCVISEVIVSCRPLQQCCVPGPSLKAAGHSQLRSTGSIGVWQQRCFLRCALAQTARNGC
jgi:hypothetical protein